MLPYTVMLLIPLLIGLNQPIRTKRRNAGLWLYFIPLLVFVGLRDEIGPDWSSYENIYIFYLDLPDDVFFGIREPGFFFINKLADASGFGLQGVFFCSALVFLIGCFAYARVTPNAWLAIAAVMPYLIFVISMSGIRQASAIGIGFLMFSRWQRSTLIEKYALIALAISFHNSAVVLLLFVIFSLRQGLTIRLLMVALVLTAAAYGLNTEDTVERYSRVYLEENLISGGAFFHVLLIAFPSALYLYYRKKLAAIGLADRNVLLAALLTLGLMPLLTVSSTGVDRLTLYFSFVQMWVYPAILQAGVLDRSQIRLGLAVLIISIFIVYFSFGTHASAYVPYKNVLMPL